MADLKQQISDDVKAAMLAKDKPRVDATRLIKNAIQQEELATREELDDSKIIALFDKLAKQRRESIEMYRKAERQDLLEKEQYELDIIQTYLPKQLTEAEINELISKAIADTNAESMRDMGKVMGILKPLIQGRADGGAVSKLVKEKLA